MSAQHRIENLYYECCESSSEGRDAIRVGFTTAKGIDRQRVVWIDESVEAGLDVFVTEALARAEQTYGPLGREMLLVKFLRRILCDDKEVIDSCPEITT